MFPKSAPSSTGERTVFSEAESRPGFVIVRVGSLDDPEIGKPVGTIWTGSAPSWACIDEDLPRGEGQILGTD